MSSIDLEALLATAILMGLIVPAFLAVACWGERHIGDDQ